MELKLHTGVRLPPFPPDLERFIMALDRFKIAYVDYNTKHTSGIIRETEWASSGWDKNDAMGEALSSFVKKNPNCDVLRIIRELEKTRLERLDENNGEPLTGLGFKPQD